MRRAVRGRRSRLTVAIVTAGAAVCTLLARPAFSSAAPPDVQAVFQHPQTVDSTGASHEAVADNLESLFAQTSPSWSVHLSMYDLEDGDGGNDAVDRLLTSMIDSHSQLYVVLDVHDAPKAYHPKASDCDDLGLRSGTGPFYGSTGWSRAAIRIWCGATVRGTIPGRFSSCSNGCLGPRDDRGIDHNKFVLFSGPGGQQIVTSSSANWTEGQLTAEVQTMLIIRNHSDLYSSWLAYWNALHADKAQPNYGDSHVYDGTDINAFFFPRSTDPRITALKKVDCSSGTWIELASNIVVESTITDQLRSMVSAGCRVRVVLGESAYAGMNGIPHWCFHGMHAKDLIINGTYVGGTVNQSVWTGSRPWGGGADTSDNVQLRLHGADPVREFQTSFNAVWYKSYKLSSASSAGADCPLPKH